MYSSTIILWSLLYLMSFMSSVLLNKNLDDFNNCTLKISLMYFGEKQTIGVIDEESEALLVEITNNLHSIVLFNKAYNNSVPHCNVLRNYILTLKRFEDLQTLKNLKENNYCWNNVKTKFIAKIENTNETPTSMSKNLQELDLINVLLLVKRKSGIIIYVYLPYGEPKMETLGVCTSRTLKLKGNINSKSIPENFNLLPVKVGLVIFPPVAFIKNNKFDGIELKMLDLVAKIANFTPIYQVVSDWGSIAHLNQSKTGLMGALLRNEIDVGIGTIILTLNRYNHLSVCYPHTLEKISICVPKAGEMGSWQVLFRTLNKDVWFAFLLTYFFFSLSIWITGKSPLGICFLNTFSLVTGCSIKIPKNIRVSQFYLWWTIFSFFMSSLYQTKFVSFMIKNKYNDQPDSIQKILNNYFKIFIYPTYRRFFQSNDAETVKLLENTIPWVNLKVAIERVAYKRDSAVIFAEIYTNYHIHHRGVNNHQRLDSLIHCFSHSGIYPFQNVVITRKGFPLRQRISILVQRIVESGFLSHWRKDYLKKDKHTDRISSVSLKQLNGCFYILLAGTGIALIVFLLEILHMKLKKLIRIL